MTGREVIAYCIGVVSQYVFYELYLWNRRRLFFKKLDLKNTYTEEKIFAPGDDEPYYSYPDQGMFISPDPKHKELYDKTLSMQFGMDHRKDIEITGVYYVRLKDKDYINTVDDSHKVIINNHLFLYWDIDKNKHLSLMESWELLDSNSKRIEV